jgi:hypothetical protein
LIFDFQSLLFNSTTIAALKRISTMVLSGTGTQAFNRSGAHWNFGNSRRIPVSLALKNAPSLTSRQQAGTVGIKD